MAIQQQNNGASDGQKHTAYPYYSLQKALEVANMIRELGGVNGDVQKSLIAHRMAVDEASPTLMGILGAARLYGLIDGRGVYRLTDVAKEYFLPTNDRDRSVALLRMVKGPPLFAALIDRFDGSRLPAPDVLVNILHREHKIAESWRTRAVSLFLSSLREANALDSAGYVRYKASLHAGSAVSVGSAKSPPIGPDSESVLPDGIAPVMERAPRRESPPPADMDVWSFSIGAQSVRVETSKELSSALWDKLSRYINVLKPENEK
ncbi:MAG: hypothetical protein JWN24_4590 [Phycisphaerales bacterium]|nr:hypothetical protein [Phycisphaerales bacterium]